MKSLFSSFRCRSFGLLVNPRRPTCSATIYNFSKRSFSQELKPTDQQIHQSYNFFKKLQVLAKTTVGEYNQVADELCFMPVPFGFLTYIDIKHPLLEKYNFNPSEFLLGAQESFQTVYDIIQTKEFNDFIMEKTPEYEDVSYLKSISTVLGFKSLLTHQQEKNLLSKDKYSLKTMGIYRIRVQVIDEVVPITNSSENSFFSSLFGQPPTPGLIGFEKISNTSQSTKKTDTSTTDNDDNEDDSERAVKDTSPVPPVAYQGVLVTVICACEVNTSDDLQHVFSRRAVFYALQGDISAGDALEWKLSKISFLN